MGILSHEQENNILEQHGFKYKSNNVIGTLKNCYEKKVQISSTYDAYVAVIIPYGICEIYVEYDFGGEVERCTFLLDTVWSRSTQNEFFEELDMRVTDHLKSYE